MYYIYIYIYINNKDKQYTNSIIYVYKLNTTFNKSTY